MDPKELVKQVAGLAHEHRARVRWYGFFRRLHRLSLEGMGIGAGGRVSQSGERGAVAFACKRLDERYPGAPRLLFDVGASKGHFAKEAMSALVDGWTLYCFEPSRHAFAGLQAALGHRLGADAFAFNFGFGDRDGTMPLYAEKPGSGLASLYRRRLSHFGISFDGIEEVAITTIDAFCAERGIGRIHYLKLDVEGHEIKCLEGARTLLGAGGIDFIQFEFGGCNIDSRTFLQDFWYLLEGYRIMRILRDGLAPVDHYSEDCETFITQNFLAQLRER